MSDDPFSGSFLTRVNGVLETVVRKDEETGNPTWVSTPTSADLDGDEDPSLCATQTVDAVPRPMRAAPKVKGHQKSKSRRGTTVDRYYERALQMYHLTYANGVSAPNAHPLKQWMDIARNALEQMGASPSEAYASVLRALLSDEVLCTPNDEACVRSTLWEAELAARGGGTLQQIDEHDEISSGGATKRFRFC